MSANYRITIEEEVKEISPIVEKSELFPLAELSSSASVFRTQYCVSV